MDHTPQEASMVLVVIDTQAHTERTVMVPVTATSPSPEPARILAYKPRS